MSPFIKTGLRTAGAGTAAAALALAAGAPAFAQTDYEYLAVWFNSSETDEQFASLEYEGQEGYLSIEGPDASQGDRIEYEVDFTAAPGAIELVVPYDDRCEFAADRLVCVDDGSSDIAGTFMHFEMSLGDAGAPGDTIPYTVTALVNGEDEVGIEGQVQVGEDYQEAPEGEDPGGVQEPELPGEGAHYSYTFLDQVLEDAAPGSTVNADPQFHVADAPEENRVATVVTFTDSISLESIASEDWENSHRAYAEVYYDNCYVTEWGVTCLLIDFAPEEGATYGLAAESPLTFAVTDEGVTEDDVAAYWAEDLDDAELGDFLDATGISLDYNENANLLSLVETEPSENGDFYIGYGLFLFLADIDDVDGLPGHETDGEASEQLPTTGNSSIVLVSSAAAALLAGAAVFYVMRRRKTAASWE
ncbi:LPXTG cell wall anchor domain-containing protein [Glycomyces amatae]|uniref:LPXTG cell wall anchor domain-containing protein n=1 Tax=Glycomyces amatae TaxID=2881355 RepID=UPI00272D30A9|nr:LPXTG cell wall anchor domain-containing protein [Glycomyces amatae]